MARSKAWLIVVAIGLVLAGIVEARATHQHNSQLPPPTPSMPSLQAQPAIPSDVATIPAIVHAMHLVMSGGPGQKRDWNRLRSLFVPSAQLIPVGYGFGGRPDVRAFTLEEFIQRADPLITKDGYYEREIGKRVLKFGHIAHVWSTYESRHNLNDKPFARGIHSIQLFNDGQRWWIVNVYWETERGSQLIPRHFIHSH
jgi:hypothetical protein